MKNRVAAKQNTILEREKIQVAKVSGYVEVTVSNLHYSTYTLDH